MYYKSIIVSFTSSTFAPFRDQSIGLLNNFCLGCILLTEVLWICIDIRLLLRVWKLLIVLLYHFFFIVHPYFLPQSDLVLTWALLSWAHCSPCLLCLVEVIPMFPLSLTTFLTSLSLMFSILKLLYHFLPLSMLSNLLAVVSMGMMM